jgi:ring-1,2-phenylacetyl-CoA epoxidase subunit PaaC
MMAMAMPSMVDYLLRFGDSALILSQRLCAWCGKAPALEEDIAISNVALDLLGQARMWLSLAGELEGLGRDENDLAFFRDSSEFRNLLLVEQADEHYADTMVRQCFFDIWHVLALDALEASTDERIASIARQARMEVGYHVRRSRDLVMRLGGGGAKAWAMMQAAVDKLWRYTGEMFECDGLDLAMVVQGVGFDPCALKPPWLDDVQIVFAGAGLKLPSQEAWIQTGGKRGRHSLQHVELLAEMQHLPRLHPGARW